MGPPPPNSHYPFPISVGKSISQAAGAPGRCRSRQLRGTARPRESNVFNGDLATTFPLEMLAVGKLTGVYSKGTKQSSITDTTLNQGNGWAGKAILR